MNGSLYFAWRYTLPFRGKGGATGSLLSFATLITFISVMLGSTALILALAILSGFERELRDNAIRFSSHIEITGFNKRLLTDYAGTIDTLRRITPSLQSISAFISSEGIARSPHFVDGVLVRGIQPHQPIAGGSAIQKGASSFSRPDAHEVIIGKRLAEKLRLDVGEKFTLYSIRGELRGGMPVVEQFRVIALYETGLSQYDDVYVYIPFVTAQQIFQIPPDAVSGYSIMLQNVQQAKDVASALEQRLGYPYFVLTVFELYDSMFAWIELQKEPVPLILGLISIVAVFNVVATLFMTVVQKIPSIGTIRALGVSRRFITRIFLMQGFCIGAAGTIMGCIIGGIVSWAQATFQVISLKGEIYFLSSIPINAEIWHYAVVIGMSIVLSVAAAYFPAVIGSRISIVRALQF